MDEVYIGTICLFPYSFDIYGFTQCKGQLLPISGNEMLYSIIGTTYGGNGISTFNLPDLTKAVPDANMMYYIATVGSYPQRV